MKGAMETVVCVILILKDEDGNLKTQIEFAKDYDNRRKIIKNLGKELLEPIGFAQ